MFKVATYPSTQTSGYGENLGRAARGFLAALLAINTTKPEAATATVTAEVSDRADRNLNKLYRMARYDSVSPVLSAQLRALAEHD